MICKQPLELPIYKHHSIPARPIQSVPFSLLFYFKSLKEMGTFSTRNHLTSTKIILKIRIKTTAKLGTDQLNFG